MMLRISTRCVLTGAALLTVIGVRAHAQTQADTLYACYVPSTGTVYRIKTADTPSQCNAVHGNTPAHVMFSWNALTLRAETTGMLPATLYAVCASVSP